VADSTPHTFTFGRFHFDGPSGRLYLDGGEIPLKSRELQLLSILLEHREQWVRDDDLAHALWPKAVASREELDHLVRELSAILDRGADGVATIQGQKERGYRLQIPVHAVSPAPPASSPATRTVRTAVTPPRPPTPPMSPVPAAAPRPEARSGHRRLIPRRFALLLLVAALGALAVGAVLRWVTRRAEGLASGDAVEIDLGAVRAAANSELAKGVVAARGYDLAAFDEAAARFGAAIAIEPGFAAARGALAEVSARRGDLARAKREAEVALKLEPDLASAHAALAWVSLFADWKPAEARTSAERALLLDIGEVTARRALAWSLAIEGNPGEALVEIRRTLAPGVLDPETATDESWHLFLAGKPLEARQLVAEVVRLAPTCAPARELLAWTYLVERRLGPAALELELRDRLLAGATAKDERIRRSIAGGWDPPDAGEAARLLRSRTEGSFRAVARDGELENARILVQLGESDLAHAALARAVARREGGVVLAWLDPTLAALRGNSRFRDLMSRAGIAAPDAGRPR
jgi:DNA-binding winged helix-turn-helix (wHTH) protein/tetratricopeptide (TPR) repeat protein